MKIALVAQHATPAADQADNRVLELGRSLAGNGHQVTVYAGRHKSSLPEQADLMRGVAVEYIGPMDSADSRDDAELLAQVPAFARPLHERWSEDRPDVVHAVRWTSGLAALAAARDLRVPIVQSFDSLGVAERRHHRSAPLDAGVERMRLEPAIGRSANAVVAGSSDEESDLTRLGVPRRSIKVIPCGVDTDEFTPEGPAYKGNDRYRLVTVAGGLGELDALGTLLRAVAKVPNAELVIAGGPKREALHDDLSYRRLAKLADSLDLNGRVFFAGEVGRADLPPLLRSARLCVNVGEYEPSAMASIQSMAARRSSPRRSAVISMPWSTGRPASWSRPGTPRCSPSGSASCFRTRCCSRHSAWRLSTGPGRGTPWTGSRTRRSPSTARPSTPPG
jgi:glycosyltransferase involved in cell wall biosynthesis